VWSPFIIEIKKCIIKSTPNGMLFNISVYCAICAINALNGNQVNYGIYFGDLNEIPFIKANMQIFHRSQSNCKNAPVQEFGIVRTMYIDSIEYAIQEFLSLLTGKLFVRTKSNNIWYEWKEK
jgi:hypothetical protein